MTSMVRVDGLRWDEDTEEHIALHGLDIADVYEAIDNQLQSRQNRDRLLLFCQTEGGRYLTIILARDADHI